MTELVELIVHYGGDFMGGEGRWPTFTEFVQLYVQRMGYFSKFTVEEIQRAYPFAEAEWREIEAAVDADIANAPDPDIVGGEAFINWISAPSPRPRRRIV
jgi:hypothetical protein